MSRDIDRLYKLLGVQPPRRPEGYDAPLAPVDENKLRAFHQGTLDFIEGEEVVFLIANDQAWWDADARVAEQLMRESHGASVLTPDRTRSSGSRRYYAIAFATAAALAIVAFLVTRSSEEVTLADGRTVISVTDGGRIRGLDDYAAQWRTAVEQTIRHGVKASPAITDLQASLPVLRADDVAFSAAIFSPYVTMVRQQQPELKWAALKDAERYRVELFELGSEKPMLTQETQETRWEVPAPLARGKTYRWRVFYVVGDGTFAAPKTGEKPAVFGVLDEAALERLEREEQQLAGSQLLLGLLYARAGLLDEAERSWKRLQKQNPRSELVEQLLEGLRSLRKGSE